MRALRAVILIIFGAISWRAGQVLVAQAMKRFAKNPLDDGKFWEPAPLLARLVAEGKTFNG